MCYVDIIHDSQITLFIKIKWYSLYMYVYMYIHTVSLVIPIATSRMSWSWKIAETLIFVSATINTIRVLSKHHVVAEFIPD